ncbi:hypothetical protein LTR08_008168 [Meristemomyces frigidus]|nr:hypothetical protein LTR08_008168 [Meristemomyces frigidus]
MSGANNHSRPPTSHREFTRGPPPVRMNSSSGQRSRYVPPQMRRQTLDHPVRPESSMSNMSFATQGPGNMAGGVSLRDSGGGFGGYNMMPQTGGSNANPYMNMGQNIPVGAGYPVGLGAMPFRGGENYDTGYNVPGYNFAMQQPVQRPAFLDSSNLGMAPAHRRLSIDVFGPQTPSNTSSNSAHDSVNAGAKGASIADMIRSGATYAGDDEDTTLHGPPMPSQGQHGRKHGRASISGAISLPRTTRLTGTPAIAQGNPLNTVVSQRGSNTKGNAAAYLAVDMTPLPDWYDMTATGFKPSMEMFFDVMPAIEPCRYASASTAGVIRVTNIPFDTPRSEMTAFVGRNAKIISQPEGSPYHGVHIIMERHTGKTMDAFIEFSRAAEATYVVNQFQKRIVQGRHPKVGDRLVEVLLSSQEELMGELFPRSKNVRWEGAAPVVLDNPQMFYAGVEAAGFTGFMQSEEVVMVVKHAETPFRSPFAQRCILRVYESWISTLHKYPWFAHEHVKMSERRLVYDATLCIVRSLIAFLRRTANQVQQDISKPTGATLQELAVAALTCPGFSESQKATLVWTMQQGGFAGMTSPRGMNISFGGNSKMSSAWPFKVLARAPTATDTIVKYFAKLMSEATTPTEEASLADRHAMRASGAKAQGPFGKIEFDYGNATTLAEVGKIELRTIETLLARILPRANLDTHKS